MVTVEPKKAQLDRKWVLVDASDKILGRVASKVAHMLRGKGKPIYTPHVDAGDFVVVVNAEKIKLTGKKLKDKMYYRHSGYPGGLKAINAKDLLEKRPEEVISKAVKGMLPKNRLGRKLIKKLKVYAGNTHPHEAQQPAKLEL